jgi:hypothetical protein
MKILSIIILGCVLVFFITINNQKKVATFTNKKPEYVIDINKFGIKNNGSSSKKTSIGINKALQYAKQQNFAKITFPKGIYLIDENNPIIIDLKNTIVDLNGSTLQVNTNGLEKYSVVEFRNGADYARLTNGIVRGDRDTHNYKASKNYPEWANGVVFKSGTNIQVDNITATNFPGYGIYTENGVGVAENRYYTLNTEDTISGAISDNGKTIPSNTKTRTSKPYDISVCGGQFEVGYTLGYQGYPYLKNKEYTSYFYDKDMKFINKKECLQFKKVDVPKNSKYVYFVYPQRAVISNEGYYAWITNLKPPTNVKFINNTVTNNQCLGFAFCGGQKWLIENNIFDKNGGKAADGAIDFEDGWNLMQDIVVKGNKFTNNGGSGDLNVCAGDNFTFDNNSFTGNVDFWGRASNVIFINNTMTGGSIQFQEEDTPFKISGNKYNNTDIRAYDVKTSEHYYNLNNETIINCYVTLGKGTKLINSTFSKGGYITGLVENSILSDIGHSEIYNLTVRNSKITNVKMNLQASENFQNCTIINSSLGTHSNTIKLNFSSCEFIDSELYYNTWGSAPDIVIKDCKISINTNIPLLSLSAGKVKNLVFENNTITNKSTSPIFSMDDTTYSIPKGNMIIKNNNITQTNFNYIFDGVDIKQGIFNLISTDNKIFGAELLNPKYINNNFFNNKNGSN